MADDIRLVINVEKKGVLSAITATENLEKKVKKLSDTYSRGGISSSEYAKGISQIAKAAKVSQVDLFALGKAIRYNSDALKAEAIAKKASADADKLYAQARREATQEDQRRASVIKSNIAALNEQRVATQKNSSELKSFRTSTDAVYAAEQKLLRLKKLLRTEVENGNMTMREAAAVQMQYKQSLNSMGGGLTQTKRQTNQLGVIMQQTGYQVGDFAVQVGSGQNAMVAFGQQATQLVGTMAMFAKTTKMIALFSGLGIAIPIISGLAAAWMRVNEAAKETEDTQDDLKKSVDSVLESLRDANDEWAEFQAGLAKGQTGFVDQIAAAAQEVRDAHALLATLTANLPKEANLGGMGLAGSPTYDLTGLRAYIFGNGELEDAIDRVAAAEERHNEFKMLSLRISEQSAQTESNNIRDRMTLLRVEQEFGEDSLELRAAAFKQEIAIFEQEQKREGLSATLIQGLVDQLQAEEDLKLEMIATAEATQEFLDKLFSIDFSKAIAGATTLGNKMERLAGGAWTSMQEGYEFALRSNAVGRGRGLASGPTAEEMANTPAGQLAAQDAWEPPKSKTKTSTKGGGGGKSPQEQLAEFLVKKQEEADLQSQLVGLFGEERDLKSELIKFEQEYGKVASETQAIEFEATLQQIAADKERQKVLEEAKQQQEQLADYIANSMGDALMSIVDGTMSVKDAFKSMAADIIKELYRVLVVQQMVNAAKSFLGFADGGAFSGGTEVKAYANGGVVGGPTTFPMAGGKTGLMGEAGPEAIMPLKRGANGKLGVQMEGGGGDTINVVQNFNFQANGDATIKQLIAQAAPKIAQMTKSSLLDDRRRGGSTKAAFG